MIRAAWRQLSRGLGALVRRRDSDAAIDDEVAHYLEQSTSAHLARGLTPRAARHAALLEMRGALQIREQVRDSGWESGVAAFIADIRYAVRRLRRSPGFATAAILTLAIGIGGATAIYSAVRPILIDALPYPDAADIRMIWELNSDGSRNDGTFAMYRRLGERIHSFEALAVFRPWQPTHTGGERPDRLDGQRVSSSYFGVLGVAPALGRDFVAEDDVASAPSVVILSHALWQSRFAADPAILGRHIRLDDRDHTVVGVMPASFDNVLRPDAGLWAPLQYDIDEGRAWGHHLRTIGRLRAGVVPDDAVRELNALGSSIIAAERPPTYGDDVLWTAPLLQHDLARGVRPALLAMLGAVTLLLVMACVSVANLILVRSVQRRGEFALRMSLGAGRGRMVRQLVTEGLVLTVAGAALGMAVAQAGIRALVAHAPAGLPRVDAIGLDASTLLLASAVTMLVGIVFGVTPSLIGDVAGTDANRPGTRHTAGRRHHRIRSGLVIAQIALALVLLSGSGLLLRSLQRLLSVPTGFDAAGTLSLQIQVTGGRTADDDAVRRYFTQVLDEAGRVPGVAAAGLTNQLPLSGDHDTWGVHFETGDTRRAGEPATFRYAVTPGYFEATGIPLRSGRLLDDGDRAGAPLAAVINESLARRRFPDRDPLGQQLRIGPTDSAPYTVVGVVGDVTHESLALGASYAVYITTDQWRFGDRVMTLVVRAPGDVATLATPLRDAIWSVDSDQPITRVVRLDDLVAASAAERKFALMVFQAFALAALLLAATGLHGVVAGSVAERTRELGIRSALGAARPALVSLVLAQGLRLAGIGIAAGLVGAVVASRAIESLLFGVSRLDAPTYAAVVLLLTAVALLASGVPAWRAGRTDPAITLRTE